MALYRLQYVSAGFQSIQGLYNYSTLILFYTKGLIMATHACAQFYLPKSSTHSPVTISCCANTELNM